MVGAIGRLKEKIFLLSTNSSNTCDVRVGNYDTYLHVLNVYKRILIKVLRKIIMMKLFQKIYYQHPLEYEKNSEHPLSSINIFDFAPNSC